MPNQSVIVLDFGGQYNQLIARRVRECNVYCEVKPHTMSVDEIRAFDPIGIIFTGGPQSVYAEGSPQVDPEIFQLGIPILGICYGCQLMAQYLGGEVTAAGKDTAREYGKTQTWFDTDCRLFRGLPEQSITWMSHGDYMAKVPESFRLVAHSAACPTVGICDEARGFYGVQFHPEVNHTEYGQAMLRNFLYEVCGASGDWTMGDFMRKSIESIRAKVGDGKVLLALSGGVDSSVAAALLDRAVGDKLTCIFVDHGLMRKNEGDEVEAAFAGRGMKFIRVNAEGTVSYRAMLFVPAKAPYDYYTRDYVPGLRLYSNGVMIMEKCPDLLPECFRFVRGIVDSPDLSLNISREMLQHDRQLKLISMNLEKKIKGELSRLMECDREKYEKFFNVFGTQLKYGIIGDYGMKRDLLTDLLLYRSAEKEKLVSLREYVDAMPENQKYIYYAAAETPERAAKLPQTEQVRAKGFDILCFSTDADEFVAEILGSYAEKKFCNVCSQDLGLESDEEKAAADKTDEEYKPLTDFVKETLGDAVANVKISRKLKNYAVCLSVEGGITLEMERYFHAMPGADPNAMRAQRVLELNLDHPAVKALDAARQENPERAAVMAKVLFAQAQLVAGITPDDPAEYGELVCKLF